MLRTCMGNEGTTSKDYHGHDGRGGGGGGVGGGRGGGGNGHHHPRHQHHPHAFSAAEKSAGIFDNGDIFSRQKSEELREAFSDVFPEDIPGLPRHRPGLYSPR